MECSSNTPSVSVKKGLSRISRRREKEKKRIVEAEAEEKEVGLFPSVVESSRKKNSCCISRGRSLRRDHNERKEEIRSP